MGTRADFVVPGGANFDSGTLVVDAANNRVGVAKTNPTTALDVNGTVTATALSGSLAASNLTGTTLPATIVSSSLTSVGTLGSLSVTGTVTAGTFSGSLAASGLTGTSLPATIVSSSLTSVGTLSSLAVTGALTVDTSTLVVDAANNRVGVNVASPATALDVIGTATVRAAATQDGVALAGRAGGTSGYEVTVVPTTLTADRTLTLPNVTGTAVTTANLSDITSTGTLTSLTVSGALTVDTSTLVVDATNNRVGVNVAAPATPLDVVGSVQVRAAATQDGVLIAGRAGGTASYDVTLTPTTLSADRTLTLPDATGTVVTTGNLSAITSTGTLSSLTVTGNLTIDTNTLYVDPTNNRVGIVNTSPTTALDVVGTVTATTFAGSGASLTAIPYSAISGVAWSSWTPTLWENANVAQTVNRATYVQVGKIVHGVCHIASNGTGTANGSGIQVRYAGLPAPAYTTNALTVGTARYQIEAGNYYTLEVSMTSAAFSFKRDGFSYTFGSSSNGAGGNTAIGTNDIISFHFTYEAA